MVRTAYALFYAVLPAVGADGFEELSEFGVVLQQDKQIVQAGDGGDGQAVLFFHFLNGGQFTRAFSMRSSAMATPAGLHPPLQSV